jgi:Integrase core domain
MPPWTQHALVPRLRYRSYIERGSPWENPFVESFSSRMRDEVLSTEQFRHSS